MQKITFEDTTVTKQPYVTIDNVEYPVQDGTYSGGTDLDASTFNTMQNNIETELNTKITSSDTNAEFNGRIIPHPIAGGFDANTLLTNGFYQVADTLATYQNLPFSFGMLWVLNQVGGNTGAFQTVQIGFASGGYIVFRMRTNNNWTAWKKITTTDVS